MKHDSFLLKVAACLGFLAIGLGAFGAHGMKGKWDALPNRKESAHREEVWRTAAQYHLIHSVALLALALAGASRRFVLAGRCWITGIIVFSGSLYLFAFTGIKQFGAVTPFGGLFLMAGWLALLVRFGEKKT
ncbi:MAG: DUF423 domain-containing protein [Verrucomicrobiaceae bacterium]